MSRRKNRRIPTKSELIQLQKLYRTDEKIAERLGGIPSYLVAYWRRKKNVPKHHVPKFSEKEIHSLWERFGDDDRCGLELGISKAAFYNWRRRYGIKEKPAFLKLEQLELNFPGVKLNTTTTSLYGKQTVVQKLLARAADLDRVGTGETVTIEPDVLLCGAASAAILAGFRSGGTEFVWNPSKIVIALGALAGRGAESISSDQHRELREFARRQSIKSFYELSEGCLHQVALEKGLISPGQLIVGSDPQVGAAGAVGAMAGAIDTQQAAGLWGRGEIQVVVPATARIDITGRRPTGVYARDISLLMIRQLRELDTPGRAIELHGSVVSQMTISERFTLCAAAYLGGAGYVGCVYDATTRRYLTGRTLAQQAPVVPDKDADYGDIYRINIEQLLPQLARADSPADGRPVSEREGAPVNLIVIGGEVCGRFDDLRVATDILKGKRIHPECRLLIYPASRSTYLEALKKGLVRALIDAGAAVLFPGYWPTASAGESLLAGSERALVAGNAELLGPAGDKKSEIYLCSAATAAASALNAAVTDPTRFVN